MATVRSKNTRLEEEVARILDDAGLGPYARHARSLPGTPDFVFEEQRLAVFVDSCFWHGCPKHLRRPGSNTSYWQTKIDMNVRRDRRQRAALRRAGWRAIRVWEHDVGSPPKVLKKVRRFLGRRAGLQS